MNLPAPRQWALGLALSLAVAWLAGAVLLDTVQPLRLDAALGRYVAAPGTVLRTRSEGWASSRVGEHGIRGLPAGRLPEGPKVVFWGDSFVEGAQVDDAARMAQRFGELATSAGLGLNGRDLNGKGLAGVGVATGGDALPDFLLKARATTPALGEVRLHVFVLPRMADLLPGAFRPGRASFLASPTFHLAPGDERPSRAALALAPAFRRLELAGAFAAYERLRALSPRWSVGPPVTPGTAPAPLSMPLSVPLLMPDTAAMRFLVGHALQTARENGGGGVLFLHVPSLPRIAAGAVALDDPEAALARAFADVCAGAGAGFLDMGADFQAFFRSTGRFSRGFFNTPPGSGHLNEDGHRLVAQAVVRYIQEHPDALLAR